jgi:hypothetical protein
MGEVDYMTAYQVYLESVVRSRIEYVQQWLKVNTTRFTGRPDIAIVYQTFEELLKELRTYIIPCGATCSECGLLCLDQKLHNGPHDCKTNHECPRICEFATQHEGSAIPACEMPSVFLRFTIIYTHDNTRTFYSAGHTGRHAYVSFYPVSKMTNKWKSVVKSCRIYVACLASLSPWMDALSNVPRLVSKLTLPLSILIVP